MDWLILNSALGSVVQAEQVKEPELEVVQVQVRHPSQRFLCLLRYPALYHDRWRFLRRHYPMGTVDILLKYVAIYWRTATDALDFYTYSAESTPDER